MREENVRKKQVYDRLKINKKPITDALSTLGVDTVKVTYSGSGDEGQIDDVTFYDSGSKELKVDGKVKVITHKSKFVTDKWVETEIIEEQDLSQALEDFCNDWVEIEHGGYENDDGGQGEMTIEVSESEFQPSTFKLVHGDNYVETTDYEHNL